MPPLSLSVNKRWNVNQRMVSYLYFLDLVRLLLAVYKNLWYRDLFTWCTPETEQVFTFKPSYWVVTPNSNSEPSFSNSMLDLRNNRQWRYCREILEISFSSTSISLVLKFQEFQWTVRLLLSCFDSGTSTDSSSAIDPTLTRAPTPAPALASSPVLTPYPAPAPTPIPLRPRL